MRKIIIKYILILAGLTALGFGIIGIFLPVLPTIPFLLLAGLCFVNTSPKLHKWLYSNRFFGKLLKDYHEKKHIPMKVKIFSVSLLWASILFSAFYLIDKDRWLIRILLIIVAIAVSLHILLLGRKKR